MKDSIKVDRKSSVKDQFFPGRIDTGWSCCVCLEIARVFTGGFMLCEPHYIDFVLGLGDKTIADMRREEKEKKSEKE